MSTELKGIDLLRFAVRNFNDCKESFNERFTVEELIKIAKAFQACSWDYYPDTWTELHIQLALTGFIPDWNEQGPIYINLQRFE